MHAGANDPPLQLRFRAVGKWGGEKDDELNLCGDSGHMNQLALEKMASSYGMKPESHLPNMTGTSGSGVCYAARPYNLLIGADGKIMKCTISLGEDPNNIVGKLQVDGSLNLDLEKFAAWVARLLKTMQCKKCFYSPMCQGISCPKIRMDHNERPCPDEKRQIGPALRSIWELGQAASRKVTA